jgi:hypothetical protein
MIWIETRSQEQVDAWRSGVRLAAASSAHPSQGGNARKKGANDNVMLWSEALEEIRRDPQSRLTIAVRYLPKPAAFREACRALRQRINALQENRQPYGDELFALHRLAAIGSVAAHEQLEVIPFSVIDALALDPVTIGWKSLPLLGEKDASLMEALWGPPLQHVTGAILYPHIALAAADRFSTLRTEEANGLHAVDEPSGADAADAHVTASAMFAKFAGWFGWQSRKSANG